ncbi:uncharacterized protein LOC126092806 [Schistocerca cancellata]|uniref:uncharacterized protein LOC126092806 n=1 Tax=Schistocerca cancellata TaxID=274614 RepID=UPI0021184F40|nr:uncharacterized protein LOC126092806 [Schistocerca cancellata]
MCQECFEKLSKCPTCRATLRQKLRSLSMEHLAEVVRTPCEYSEDGCPELLPLKTKRRHEETCAFRPDAIAAECPLLYSCPWVGSRGAVEQHVRYNHRDELVAASDGAFRVGDSSITVLEFDTALFVVRAEPVPEADFTSHYVHVGHVAQGLCAAKPRYRFKVQLDPDGPFYKGHVTNYSQQLQDLAAAGGCLFYVSQVDQPSKVSYSGTIKKLLV